MINKIEAEKMARVNILPFWQGLIDRENGGFYGEADFYGKINKDADKGCILNSRILWTFSSAFRLFKDESYLNCAHTAYKFLKESFLDKEYGGLYWLVDRNGQAVNTRKQFYNLAFGIYALSEYYLACGNKASLELAIDLFEKMEKYALDPVNGGYIEACSRDWSVIDDFRLSEKEINCPKSMNTNLHVLEAYTTLLYASADERVKKALSNLLRVSIEKIVNSEWHFDLFFDMEWKALSSDVSYGHDIEGSWLMYEAALAIGDELLIGETRKTALSIADVIFKKAIDLQSGGFSEGSDRKEWWPQAEAVVGFYNAYELLKNEDSNKSKKFLETADSIWQFISKYFVDYENGDWHNELDINNKPDKNQLKAGFWKCPYHNARACFEIVKRNV